MIITRDNLDTFMETLRAPEEEALYSTKTVDSTCFVSLIFQTEIHYSTFLASALHQHRTKDIVPIAMRDVPTSLALRDRMSVK